MDESSVGTARRLLRGYGFYLVWLVAAALSALVAFQVHATIVFIGLEAVENPATRPAGWNSDTIYGLSRFAFLALGALWLFGIVFLERYLSEGNRRSLLRRRAFIIASVLALIYGATLVILSLSG